MFNEALKVILDLKQSAITPTPIAVTDPTKWLFGVGGQIVAKDKPIPPRTHAVDALDDFLAAIESVDIVPEGFRPSVWFNEIGVIGVIDNADFRKDSVSLTFRESEAFKSIKAASGKWIEHRDFCRILRTSLSGVIAAKDLYDTVKGVKFEGGQTVTRSLSPSKLTRQPGHSS